MAANTVEITTTAATATRTALGSARNSIRIDARHHADDGAEILTVVRALTCICRYHRTRTDINERGTWLAKKPSGSVLFAFIV
jgi:hypothetical protein